MSPMDLFWLFFMISALQPLLRQRMLEASRQRLLAKIEKRRGSRVILLVHRQETMSLLGFPIFRYIDIHDSEEVIRAIQLTDPSTPIDLVLHTPGGLVLASLQIARAIAAHPGKVTAFVPHYAMSGGTLIALAADEIVMSPHAVLGPVDPQLGQFPAASLLRVLKEKPIERIEDRTLILADQAEKAMAQVRESVAELLAGRYPEERVEEISRLLSEGRWTHDHPITYEAACSLGLRVSREMPREFLDLMRLYPQPTRRQPGVEYIPEPRRAVPRRSGGGTAGAARRRRPTDPPEGRARRAPGAPNTAAGRRDALRRVRRARGRKRPFASTDRRSRHRRTRPVGGTRSVASGGAGAAPRTNTDPTERVRPATTATTERGPPMTSAGAGNVPRVNTAHPEGRAPSRPGGGGGRATHERGPERAGPRATTATTERGPPMTSAGAGNVPRVNTPHPEGRAPSRPGVPGGGRATHERGSQRAGPRATTATTERGPPIRWAPPTLRPGCRVYVPPHPRPKKKRRPCAAVGRSGGQAG
ncbi:MAG: hypothetical protein KatS3mg076_3273 [Candidatus Binatia bacterium]|nr:MAG: hypothetical protein KatS3mg076_3273 [Candidatus Binatia bacterium]